MSRIHDTEGEGLKPLSPELEARPHHEAAYYHAAGKLDGHCALITDGDAGIGRAVAALYAREGADIAITYPSKRKSNAEETQRLVEEAGRDCYLIEADFTKPASCKKVIEEAIKRMGTIDILVSNGAHELPKGGLAEISLEEWEDTFKTNLETYFLLAKYAVPHMKVGSAIIVTNSEGGTSGSHNLLDDASTRGAIAAFTRSLAKNLMEKSIRVNAVSPGLAEPEKIAPSYVFLASNADSGYVTGTVLQMFGGETAH